MACDGLRVEIQDQFSTDHSKGGPLYGEILHPLLVFSLVAQCSLALVFQA